MYVHEIRLPFTILLTSDNLSRFVSFIFVSIVYLFFKFSDRYKEHVEMAVRPSCFTSLLYKKKRNMGKGVKLRTIKHMHCIFYSVKVLVPLNVFISYTIMTKQKKLIHVNLANL